MSENPSWEVTLGRSSDLVEIAALPYAFTHTPTFNRPGAFSMTMPLDAEAAYKVAKHSTCVICERNQAVKWSGSIVSVVRDPGAMTLSLTAVGWLDELNHRQVRADEEAALTFTGIAGGAIVQSLVSRVNAQKDSTGAVQPTHLGFSTYADTQVRTRSYKRGQSYGQAWQELSDIENGLDIRVDPLTRKISTLPPTAYADRSKVLFGYGVEPFNLSNAPESDDGTSTAERVTVVGSNGLIVVADDPAAAAAHGGFMRERWISLSDVSDATILESYANAELVYGLGGKITYDLKPTSYGDLPRLYDDFELGDKIYLSVDAGALQVERQAVRVFSVTIEVDALGNEVITQIETAPQ